MSKSPERICHLFASQETGGLEKHVQEQCLWQSRNTGAEVFVIAHPRYRKLFPQGVRFLAVDTDRSRRHPLLLLTLLRALRQYRFDVIHGHGGKPALLLRLLQPLVRSRCVITRHNSPNPRDIVARGFRHRIAVSHKAVADSSLDWTIIPNGTELPPPGLPPAELEPGRPAVLAVARLVHAKGIDILLEAWAQADTGEARLYILGDGPEREAMEVLAERLGVAHSVRFVGFTREVPAWYRAVDLLVISSRYEGGPYTVAEALLSECPVVSTDVGYVAENIPGQWLLRDFDPQTLARSLSAALANPGQIRADYADSFARAQARLTLDAMAGATWQVYRDTLAD